MKRELLVHLTPEQQKLQLDRYELEPPAGDIIGDLLLELAKAKQAWASLENFMPTSEQINNLPEGIRHYIMMLETKCDPAGDLAARRCCEITMGGLMNRLSELGEGFEND
tara:strand:- start:140 stop:469 length:330 start_codon:yes stop_codon:yes gene_type:complete